MLKKILSLAVSSLMIFGVLPNVSAFTLSEDVKGTQYEEAAEALGSLNIMVGDKETGAFRPEDPILRSEAAKVMVYSIGLEDIAQNNSVKSRFPDVVEGHWATGAINTAEIQRMVVGYEDGTFRPDDKINLAEAITMVVRAIGYEPAAQSNGGYPTGYAVVAAQNGILRGVKGNGEVEATRGDVAQLIYNALTTNIMEQTGFGADVTYSVVDKTLLKDKLDVEKLTGQVTATSDTRLTSSSSMRTDEVEISGEIYKIGTTNAKSLLGYNVLFYARTDRATTDKTLIMIRPEANKNQAITITRRNLHEITGTIGADLTVRYWQNKETDREPRRVLIHAEANLIYNGKAEVLDNIDLLTPTEGQLTLLDTNMDDKYDIVFVNDFENVVVEEVSLTTGRVTDKYANSSPLILDEQNTNIKFTITKDGAEIELADLKEWDVLSVTRSKDGNLIKVYVSTESVSGSVEEISNEKYTIAGTEYEKAANYTDDIRLLDQGTFYLDMEGKIAAVDTTSQISENYAYVTAGQPKGSFEDMIQVKMFTKNGDTVIYDVASKIRVNTEYNVRSSDVLERLSDNNGDFVPQLISYEMNSKNEISAINTAVDNTSTGAPIRDKFTLNARGNMTYKAASNKLGSYNITTSTIVFDIPAGKTDTADFTIRDRGMFSNDTSYTAEIYDLTEELNAKVVLITSSTGIAAAESSIAVVDRISKTQNAELTYVDKLYAVQDGKRMDILAADQSTLVKGDPAVPLEQGDIIQYRTNARGEIDRITLLFDISARTKTTEALPTDLKLVYGTVDRKFTGSINVNEDGSIQNFATTDANVYEYNPAKSTNQVTVVTAAEITKFAPDEPSHVFLKIYKDVVQDIVIIRDTPEEAEETFIEE